MTTSPAYPLLFDPDDLDAYHTHHIISFINQRALQTDANYSGNLSVTAGYACPKENDHSPESQHIYGKAFDFDYGANDNITTSEQNYLMYEAGKSASATWSRLYQRTNSGNVTLPPPYSWPAPSGVFYSHGHHDWRGW